MYPGEWGREARVVCREKSLRPSLLSLHTLWPPPHPPLHTLCPPPHSPLHNTLASSPPTPLASLSESQHLDCRHVQSFSGWLTISCMVHTAQIVSIAVNRFTSCFHFCQAGCVGLEGEHFNSSMSCRQLPQSPMQQFTFFTPRASPTIVTIDIHYGVT